MSLSGQDPAPDSTGNPNPGHIKFTIDAAVDPEDVTIFVNNTIVWENDTGANGWSGSRTDDLEYTLYPPGYFPSGRTLTIRVTNLV